MSKTNIRNLHPKLEKSIESMLVDLKYKMPFYGEYNLFINFKNGDKMGVDTCGVNVSKTGMNFYYSTEFLDKLTQKQVNFVVIHEDFHLLFSHPQRTVTGRFDPHLANIAQDMIINTIIWTDINHGFIEVPKDEEGRNMGVFLPKEYDGEPVFEPLYNWLKEKKDEHEKQKKANGGKCDNQCQTCEGSGKVDKDKDQSDSDSDDGQSQSQEQGGNESGQGQGEGEGDGQDGQSQGQGSGSGDGNGQSSQSQQPCPDCGGSGHQTDGNGTPLDSKGKPAYGDYGQHDVDTWSLDSILDNLDKTKGQYMDSHIPDEIPQELRDAITKNAIDSLRARGLTKGGIEDVIGKLRKKRKDYLKEIKRSISNEIMGDTKHKSITRPNRRGIPGLKGNKKLKNKVNVILDVSGSMGGLFEKVLAFVYRNDIEINLIQCDTRVTDVQTIKNKKKLELVTVKGLGGTILQPGIDEITENYNKYNNVILTDGMTDTLDFTNVRGKTLIISTDVKCPTMSARKVKQIIVEKEY